MFHDDKGWRPRVDTALAENLYDSLAFGESDSISGGIARDSSMLDNAIDLSLERGWNREVVQRRHNHHHPLRLHNFRDRKGRRAGVARTLPARIGKVITDT